jgi:CRISPR-associated exonuclease Cas4
MGWLLLLALLLGGLGVWLLLRAGSARRQSGLPQGRVTYVDTGAWQRCERPLFSGRYRLTGRPDYLVARRDEVIPVEVKSGTAPAEPYASHILQLAAYCLLVEEQEGRAPAHGILKYDDRAFEIDYSAALRRHLLDTLAAMRDGLGGRRGPDRSHDDPARCGGCGYRERCDQRLG